ncbi:sortase B protein-sorting domain-containing protein [Lutibacter oceani]
MFYFKILFTISFAFLIKKRNVTM